MRISRLAILLTLSALSTLTGCAYYGGARHVSSAPPPSRSYHGRYVDGNGSAALYTVRPGEVDPKIQPYSVNGKTYWPVQSALGFRQEGYASWYGMDFHGKRTATGETYDMFGVSAAHKTLPLGSKVRVTNLENGRHVDLTINDRGPFVDGRVIDLSYAAAQDLGMARNGLARVRVDGLADNPVLARGNSAGPALAANSARSARKSRSRFVERGLADESAAAAPAHAAVYAADRPAGARYCIQVGAFAYDANARKVKDHLVQNGFLNARVRHAVRGGRELSVVLAGSFDQRDQAEVALQSLRTEFPGCFINTGA